MLQISLDFWQEKVLEQITYCDSLDDEDEHVHSQANKELDYFLAKLSWDSLRMEEMDVEITKFLREKKKDES